MVATGFMLHTALLVASKLAANGVNVGMIDLFDISHFNADRLQTMLSNCAGIVTLEEGFRGRGGVDAMLFEFISRRGLKARMLNLGVGGQYRFELGTRAELHEQVGIGPEFVEHSVVAFIESLSDEGR
jgi:transketolase